MTYDYRCTNCQKPYEVWQDMNDKHSYTCPICGQKCIREFNAAPAVKLNEGFYTWQFSKGGEWVGSHKEYEEKLDKTRTITGMDDYLGVNHTKEEYAVEYDNDLKQQRKKAAEENAATEQFVYEQQKRGRID